MKRYLLSISAFFLACGLLRANPLDQPWQILVDTTFVTTSAFPGVVLSTTNFPSANTGVNQNALLNQWCVSHVVVSAASAPNVTLSWGTQTLTAATTDYSVTPAVGFYDEQWTYRTPYCAPVGKNALHIQSSVAGSTVTVEGYLWKGWTP